MITILQGDCRDVLKTLPDCSVHCCVTSPPYWGLRDWGWITQAPLCPHPIEPAGTVLDPFGGSGTTGEVAASEGRKAILIELNPEYVKLAKNRGGLFYTSNRHGSPDSGGRNNQEGMTP